MIKKTGTVSRVNSSRTASQVRIIGGVHRGRRLSFAELPGLRPTGDRIRETLFNWLQPYVEGARCLDLFAGSGALGLEAASRGASKVVMIDSAQAVVRQLKENTRVLGLDQVNVIRADALQWLEQDATPFDIVFLDPPFDADLLEPLCQRLNMGWLADGAHIYLEDTASREMPRLPEGWVLEKRKSAGQVHYGLAYAPLPG